jgi:hypothetical protein
LSDDNINKKSTTYSHTASGEGSPFPALSNALSHEDKIILSGVLTANIPDISRAAHAHLIGVIEGLVTGMPPMDRAKILRALAGNALASSATRLAEDAQAIEHSEQERHRKEVQDRARQVDVLSEPDKRREVIARLLKANVTSADAILAASILFSGGGDRFPELATWQAAYLKRQLLSGSDGLDVIVRNGSGRMASGMEASTPASGLATEAQVHIAVPRTFRWDRWNSFAATDDPQRPTSADIDAIAGQHHGALVDTRRNTALAPGVGEIAIVANRPKVIATLDELAGERKARQTLANEAARLGGVPRIDGTIALADGSIVRPRPDGGRPEVLLTPEEGRRREEAKRRDLASTIVAQASAAQAARLGVPIATVTPQLHSNGIAVTPIEAATIRREVQKDQQLIQDQKNIDRRDKIVADVLAASGTRDTAPPPIPAQSWTGLAVAAAASVFGPTVSSERLRAMDNVDTSNPVVASAAEREASRTWNNIYAGALRKTWNGAQSLIDSATGTKKSDTEIAAQQHATAVWARSLIEKVSPTTKTQAQATTEANAAARTAESPASSTKPNMPTHGPSLPPAAQAPAVQSVTQLAPSASDVTTGLKRHMLALLYPTSRKTVDQLKATLAAGAALPSKADGAAAAPAQATTPGKPGSEPQKATETKAPGSAATTTPPKADAPASKPVPPEDPLAKLPKPVPTAKAGLGPR